MFSIVNRSKLLNSNVCGKCRTLITSYQTVSVQITISWTINATTTGRDLGSYIQQAITQTLNARQGHKRSYPTSYYFGSKCHTGTQA